VFSNPPSGDAPANFASIRGLVEATLSDPLSRKGALQFFTVNGSGAITEKMRITSDGKVGIGITTPAANLEVFKSQLADTSITIRNNNVVAAGATNSLIFGGWRDIAPTTHQVAKITAIQAGGSVGDANHKADLAFYTSNNGESITEKMRILALGNVGIGTTAPTAVLHIKAGTTAAGTAPIKLTSGTSLTVPESGALEFDGSTFYGTVSTVANTQVRKDFTQNNAALTDTCIPFSSGGWLSTDSNLTYSTGGLSANQIIIGQTTNTTTFNTSGIQIMKGAARVWKDHLGDALSLRQTGPGVAPNVTEGTVDFSTAANLSDYIYTNIQLNHDRDETAAISPHIHWLQTGTGTPNWLLQYRWNTLGQTITSGWINQKCTTNAFTYVSGTLHQISESADITPPANSIISDIVQFRILRDNANTSTVFVSADPVLVTVGVMAFDIHYQINALGSKLEYTK
jgi:hypothetical protein